MNEVKNLYKSVKEDGGTIKLEQWPEGHVLWFNGEIVWREWQIAKTEVKVTIEAKDFQEMFRREFLKMQRDAHRVGR